VDVDVDDEPEGSTLDVDDAGRADALVDAFDDILEVNIGAVEFELLLEGG